jgi:hypothetical protein
MLRDAAEGGVFLLNTQIPKEEVWDSTSDESSAGYS